MDDLLFARPSANRAYKPLMKSSIKSTAPVVEICRGEVRPSPALKIAQPTQSKRESNEKMCDIMLDYKEVNSCILPELDSKEQKE